MDENAGAAARHPEHDRLREEVRSWYQTSVPALGYHIERRRYGVYRRHAEDPGACLVIVESPAPDQMAEFLSDARSYFDNRALSIWLDDKELDATLGPALVASGCAIEKTNTYLAQVGPRPERINLSGITVESVTADTVIDYVLVKLKGFANSEDAPPAERLKQELALREREMETLGRFLIARAGGDPAAILGFYEGSDRLIFNLATRTPFRMSGIARQLLCQVVAVPTIATAAQ